MHASRATCHVKCVLILQNAEAELDRYFSRITFLTKNKFNDIFPNQTHFQSWTRQIQTRKQPMLRVAVLDRRRRQPRCRPTTQIWIRMTTAVMIGKKKEHPPLPLVNVLLLHDHSRHHQSTRKTVRYVWNHCKWMILLIIVWCVVGKDCIDIAVLAYKKVQ